MVAKLYQFIPSLWENLQFTEKKAITHRTNLNLEEIKLSSSQQDTLM